MQNKKAFSLEELAIYTKCQLIGNPQHLIYQVADLENATEKEASFLSNPRYKQAMKESKAGVIFIDHQTPRSEGQNYLISSNPSQAFQKLIDYLHPQRKHPSGFKGIHPSAVIHESAQLAEGVTVSPLAVIDEKVIIGPGSFIGAGVYIGPETTIGAHCIIHSHVTIREQCIIGNRVIIQPGAVIGSCGFGYLTNQQGQHTKLNQIGNVHIEDDVEIGANTTIDRARFNTTSIGKGSKLDNLVQIGHAVKVGPHNIIVAQTGIAGSTITDSHVVLAGQVAVAGHLKLAKGVRIAGKSGVSKDLTEAGEYGGIPVMPIAKYNRNAVFLRNIETYINQIKALERRVQILEEEKFSIEK